MTFRGTSFELVAIATGSYDVPATTAPLDAAKPGVLHW